MSNIVLELEEKIGAIKSSAARKANVGVVREIGDGVARVEGLSGAMLNEMLEFPGGVYGLALNLEDTEVGVIILGDYTSITEGTEVKTTGKLLQAAILRGLQRTAGIACISEATLRDFKRLSLGYQGPVNCVPLPLNFPYYPDVTEASAVAQPYVLLVGSNHRRKNRETAIRAMAAIADRWPGTLVFAGQALSEGQRALVQQLGLTQRVREILQPSNCDLRQLYSHATALVFPSRFEGFGWPIIEAQACGCPVICSQREPHPEVSGGCAMFCDADDATAFGNAVLELTPMSAARAALIAGGLKNASAHTLATLTAGIVNLINTARGRA